MASIRADRRLYLTADRERVVEHGDPDAAYLLVGVNGIIRSDDMARYDLSHDGDGHVVLPEAKAKAKAEDKMAAAPENKAAAADEETEEEYPVHVGGGWYELPDGERVRGKDEALEAMNAE